MNGPCFFINSIMLLMIGYRTGIKIYPGHAKKNTRDLSVCFSTAKDGRPFYSASSAVISFVFMSQIR